jgi:hypothetical protein
VGRLIGMMQNLLVPQETAIFDELSVVNIKKYEDKILGRLLVEQIHHNCLILIKWVKTFFCGTIS